MTLDPEGLPLPTSGLDNATSYLTFDQRLSRSWEFQAGGTYVYRLYDDPRLIGGDEVGAHARLGTRAGRNGLAFLAYHYTSSRFLGNAGEQGNAQGNALGSHQGLLGYHRRPPRGLVLEVAGGVGYVESVQKAYPSGRAAIAAVGRKASIEARYYRSFGQAFGYGQTTIDDVFSGIATWTPVRKLTVSADYNYGYRRSPGDEGNTIQLVDRLGRIRLGCRGRGRFRGALLEGTQRHVRRNCSGERGQGVGSAVVRSRLEIGTSRAV